VDEWLNLDPGHTFYSPMNTSMNQIQTHTPRFVAHCSNGCAFWGWKFNWENWTLLLCWQLYVERQRPVPAHHHYDHHHHRGHHHTQKSTYKAVICLHYYWYNPIRMGAICIVVENTL